MKKGANSLFTPFFLIFEQSKYLDSKEEREEMKCDCAASEILVYPCSGASNVGQIANEAGLRLREAGKASMHCTAGIGGHVKPIVDGAKAAKVIIALDGCHVGCVKKCLEAEGLKPGVYFVVSEELAVKKGYERPKEDDIKQAMDNVVKKLDNAME